jgi:hypothetical protein
MAYVPIVVGEASGLRSEVESIADGDSSAVMDRLEELDQSTKAAGYWNTFGTEVEFEFIDDPTQEGLFGVYSKDQLYEQVVTQMGDSLDLNGGYKKGRMVTPHDRPDGKQLMLNTYEYGTYNTDQPGTEISEARPWPGSYNEALNRYWNLIGAIGTVAHRNGKMGLILATHVSSTIMQEEPDADHLCPIEYFADDDGAAHLAATQQNLNALRMLQLDAGLLRGVVVSEAYPSKDAATAIHERRMEMRHAIVGIADPRIDMLASLAATHQVVTNSVPASALRALRPMCKFDTFDHNVATSTIVDLALYDEQEGRLVVPDQIERTGHGPALNQRYDSLVETATGGQYTTIEAADGMIIRQIVSDLHFDSRKGEIVVDPNSPYAATLAPLLEGQEVYVYDHMYRVVPHATFEAPHTYTSMRGNIPKSSTARRILGSALPHLVSPDEAASRRQAIIDGVMIQI